MAVAPIAFPLSVAFVDASLDRHMSSQRVHLFAPGACTSLSDVTEPSPELHTRPGFSCWGKPLPGPEGLERALTRAGFQLLEQEDPTFSGQ